MDKDKLQALISLLDDPDEEVFQTVEGELLKGQVEIVPELEKAWETTLDGSCQQRLETLIHQLQFRDVKSQLRDWILNSDDLLYGAYLVSKYQYPGLKYEDINAQVTKIRMEVWLELNDHLTALEKVRMINHIMFNIHGFSRNTSNFLSAQNSLICDVLDTRKGNPITLSVIYSVVAQRLGLPVFGVNLPKNFILAYMDETSDLVRTDEGVDGAVLFYINPINKGTVLGKKEIEFFIRQQKLELKVSYFLPCNNREIIQRMLNNLLVAYESAGQKGKVSEIEELLMMFS
ncbi:MAG TPA: transglutaminase-like domain-containing protein [Marinilabiliaceae bacterium]|nr:transglutaminase-like domain-containing protein [Marinilabiliaceae bacterium]